jgi:sigma-E factor negative regulatory protein RseB
VRQVVSGRAALPQWKRAVAGGRVLAGAAALAATSIAVAPAASAGNDATAWLGRAATAARQLNYVGTIVYQYGPRMETSRLVHMSEAGNEYEKLWNLEGPAREVIRTSGEVYCFYPDAKVVRIEPRVFRNAFPSLSPQQQKSLAEYYDFKRAEPGRVAGIEAEAFVFEPKDGLRYGHKFWADSATGLLLKARVLNEKGDVVEQFAFTDLAIGVKVDRSMVRPSWPTPPPDWQIRQIGPGEVDARETGWIVTRVPAGFVKIAEGYRTLRATRPPVAHLVFSDGLVTVSVFVEPVGGTAHSTGLKQEGAVNMYIRQLEDHVVTVLGEAPPVTIRQIALAVTRR